MTKEAKEIKDATAAEVVKEKKEVAKPRKGMLFSRLNYAVTVKYKGEDAVISPNAKLNIEDVDKLQKDLPKGLILRVIN